MPRAARGSQATGARHSPVANYGECLRVPLGGDRFANTARRCIGELDTAQFLAGDAEQAGRYETRPVAPMPLRLQPTK